MPPHSMLDLSLCLGITYGAVVYLSWKHQKCLLQNSSLFTVCEFELLFQDIITAWSWKVIFGWHYLRSHNIFYGYIFPNIQCEVLCLRKFDTLCASDYIILNFTLSLPADSTHISWIHSLLKYKQVRLVYISVWYTASSEPPHASHTLVQIILHSKPKLSTQSILLKFYFRLHVCKWPYFYKKLSKHCFGARCWYKHAESSNFNGFPDKRYLKARPHGPNESIFKRRKSHLPMSAGLYI